MKPGDRRAWLARLRPGDRVLAGAGLHAELRGTPSGGHPTVVVRWLRYTDGQWWGYHHDHVPVSTLKPCPDQECAR